MQVRRNTSSTASVVDGKIYVAGGCKEPNGSLNYVEVFDPETQTWSSLKTPYIEGSVLKSFELEGKFYLFGDHYCMVYDPKEGRWNDCGMHLSVKSCYCVIDKVLFLWCNRVFKWYDSKVSSWKKLIGLEGLFVFRERGYCKMVDLGGKMAVLWDEGFWDVRSSTEAYKIWCCEIAIEKRHGDDGEEIWGKVKWCDVVLRTGANCSLIHQDVISASV